MLNVKIMSSKSYSYSYFSFFYTTSDPNVCKSLICTEKVPIGFFKFSSCVDSIRRMPLYVYKFK